MASWTDRIPTFNPYVAQLPVEAMVQVGMQKQKQYDEGIQKIQTNIDNIAGLDIIRDIDKTYLQSKLNQLGNDIRTVAAGDFSNFQLVNSVNGMTNQISKDRNVLNAISSTKAYRKGLEDMDAANKAGKGSASHDWEFKTSANDWLNNKDINKTFNSGYKQYSDYKKNGLEVVKALVKNENIKDVAFEYDANGNVVGVLDAITRTKIAGITPERIQAALMVGLSPNDWQSMQIDGRYSYSNSSPQQFAFDVNKSYQEDYSKFKEKRDILSNAMDSTNSLSEKQKLQQQVSALDVQLEGISREYNNITKSMSDGGIEAAKAKLFTTKWVNNFSNTFSNQEVSQTYENSPLQQVKQFNEKQAQDWKQFIYKFEQDERFKQSDLYYKEEDLKVAKAKLKLEQDAADPYGGLPFSVNQDDLPDVTIGKISNNLKVEKKQLADKDAAIMDEFGKKGDQAWFDLQYDKWSSGKSVDPLLASHFNSTSAAKKEIIATEAMVNMINAEANSKFAKIDDYIPKGSPNIIMKFPNSTVVYTPKDFVEFNEKVKKYVTVSTSSVQSGSGGGGRAVVTYDDKQARKDLSDKEYYLYQAYKEEKTEGQKTLVANMRNYSQKVNAPYGNVIKEKNKWIGEQVKERTMAMQGVEYGVPLNNTAQKTSFGTALQQFADLSEKQGGLPNSPEVSGEEGIAKLRKIGAEIENASVQIVEGTKYAPGMYEISATGKEGETVRFRVPPEAYRSVFGDRFDADPAVQAARPILAQMQRTGGYTTSYDGKVTTLGNSHLDTTNFPNTKYYGLSGNVVKSKTSGMYSIRINVVDPVTNKVVTTNLGYPSGGLIEENKIVPALQNLTDANVFEMIYGRTPTAKELNLIKQASQKPF
jgi:hypothetical protein